MLALNAQVFPSFEWSINAEQATDAQNCTYRDTYQVPEACLNFVNHGFDHSPPSTSVSGDPSVAKKLNHNASERDRRKKINYLYASLRSLLPDADQTKKLSIPATVSRVLKYIPELQHQVDGLAQKKEQLVSWFSRQGDRIHQENQRKSSIQSSLSTVSANRLGAKEIIVQISTYKLQKCSLSDILLVLEEEGLVLINSSSSESFGRRVFHNLHLQVESTHHLECDCEALSEKIESMYENRERENSMNVGEYSNVIK